MTLIIWKANIISECSMLQQVDKLPQKELVVLLAQVGITEQEFAELHEKLLEF
ncbi:hypothetical protein PEC18_19740 [Paucibacter sp. O1-1]|nr:hypothetical protein [Paucibacter sp. O1-1]MDA3828002.1 hypothetical protein [Paucibacter sp. O1-1]